MYDRDTVELLLLALDEGMGVTRAAWEDGVPPDTARGGAAGRRPRSGAAAPRAPGRLGADEARTTRGGARVKKIEIGALYEPPESGPPSRRAAGGATGRATPSCAAAASA